ncbi:MAG: hypothetical protein LBL69_05985, partial [Zoogloeaceae bacterium]|nr:hypothetical protein [Zoogloeaceae bacterium]
LWVIDRAPFYPSTSLRANGGEFVSNLRGLRPPDMFLSPIGRNRFVSNLIKNQIADKPQISP